MPGSNLFSDHSFESSVRDDSNELWNKEMSCKIKKMCTSHSPEAFKYNQEI